jgi:glycosyltransferase involved in cell wall biosynthesis
MTQYPFPPQVGSTIVAYNSMKYLSKHHAIDFIGLQQSGDVKTSAEFVERLELVTQRKFSKLALLIQYLRGILTGVPFLLSSIATRQMKEKVKKAIEYEKYDSVLLFEMSAIQYCPSCCYSKLIVNIEDPLSIKLRRMTALPVWKLWQKAKLFMLVRLTDNYERRFLPSMAKVLLLSASDMHDMREHGEYRNLFCMPYGVELRDPAEIVGYEMRERAIVFSGNMYHPPNIDGLIFFLRDIFPLVLKEYPSALLWIVGAQPDGRIYEAAEKFGKQVVITGRVDDITVYIKRALLSICPVRLKIGIQTKILEALSWGTPVVTTSAGNSGIGGISGTHFWVEDDPLQFAQKVVGLLQGREWTTLSEEGRKLVIEQFSWESSVAILEQQIKSVVASNQ